MFSWIKALDSFFEQSRIRYLGLGLLLAWVYCTWFSGGIYPTGSELASITLRDSLAFSAVGLIILVFRKNKEKPLGAKVIAWGAAAVSLTTLSFFFVEDRIFLFAVSAIGGLASSLLWIGWGELFCRIDQDAAEACIPSSLATFVAACLLVHLLPAPAAGVLAALFPAASCVMLLLSDNAQPNDFTFRKPREPLSSMAPALGKLAFCSMVCSIATGFVTTSVTPESTLFTSENYLFAYIAGGVVAGAASIFTISHASKLDFSSLYEWVIPLIVASLSCCAMGGVVFNTIALVLACSAVLYVEVLFLVIFARITAHGFCLPSETFGIFRAVVQIGFMISGMLSAWAAASGSPHLPFCLVLICACVVMLPLFMHLQKRFEGPLEEEGEAPQENAENYAAAEPEPLRPSATKRIVEDFKLSAREAEVLEYLGKGRSVPYMREAMVLSKSTIETHIKHIYAKTGVHSKQELLDLIESYRAV